MNIDIIGVLVVIVAFAIGYRRGLIMAVFSILSTIVGLFCAMKFASGLAAWLQAQGISSGTWAPIVAFILVLVAVSWGLQLLAKVLDKQTEDMLLGWANNLIGALLYAFLGVVVWSTVLWIMTHAHLLSQETILTSKTYSYFEPVAPWTFNKLGEILPAAKDLFTDFFKSSKNVGPY